MNGMFPRRSRNTGEIGNSVKVEVKGKEARAHK